MIGLFIGSSYGYPEANVFCCRCHGGNNREWLIHRPLGSGYDCRVGILWAFVNIVGSLTDRQLVGNKRLHMYVGNMEATDQYVGYEYTMELALFEELCKFDPMGHIVEV